jgi:hypothetical protein
VNFFRCFFLVFLGGFFNANPDHDTVYVGTALESGNETPNFEFHALIRKRKRSLLTSFHFETKHFFVTPAHPTLLLSGFLNRIYGSVDLDAYRTCESFSDPEYWLRESELTIKKSRNAGLGAA